MKEFRRIVCLQAGRLFFNAVGSCHTVCVLMYVEGSQGSVKPDVEFHPRIFRTERGNETLLVFLFRKCYFLFLSCVFL